ncbi:MAG: AEC family transporter [Armatimonadota bacterium]|nr:AEC family transporter [bacterium]
MALQNTLTTILSIFLLLLVGYGAKKFRVLGVNDAGVVNSIVVYLTMPALIFLSVHSKPITMAVVKAPFLAFVVEIVVMGAAYAVARLLKLDRRTTGSLILVSAFGNTGFLGYPMVSAAFGHDNRAMLTAVMIDEFAMSLVLNSLGVAIAATFAGSRFEWKSMLELLRSPLFIATIIALLLRNTHMPDLVMFTMGFLAAATVPLAMISVGISLSTRSAKQYPAALFAAITLKMLLLPAITFFVLPFVGITGTVAKVIMLEMAVPAAVISGVIASEYDANGAFAAGAIALGTLVSVLWIPAVLMFVH